MSTSPKSAKPYSILNSVHGKLLGVTVSVFDFFESKVFCNLKKPAVKHETYQFGAVFTSELRSHRNPERFPVLVIKVESEEFWGKPRVECIDLSHMFIGLAAEAGYVNTIHANDEE